MKEIVIKRVLSLFLAFLMVFSVVPLTSYASESSTFSEYWFQDTDGSWKVRDNSGNIIKNAWLCDDAVSANGQNVWYLLDANGNMLTQGLVQDQTGNYYSLETNHNGFYGMLRYQSGTYDGVSLSLESSHSGSFAKILNQDGINALSAKYGVTNVSIDNSNCVYTSTFRSGSGSGGNSTVNPGNQSNNQEKVPGTDIGWNADGSFNWGDLGASENLTLGGPISESEEESGKNFLNNR